MTRPHLRTVSAPYAGHAKFGGGSNRTRESDVSGGQGRASQSLADLIALLLSMRKDPVSERFDQVLAEAENTHRIDATLARTLRWWQRQGMSAQSEYFAQVLPRILAALDEADRATELALEQAQRAWESALVAERAPRTTSRVSTPSLNRPPPPTSPPPFVADQDSAQSDDVPPVTTKAPESVDTTEPRSGVVSRRLLIAGLTVKAPPVRPAVVGSTQNAPGHPDSPP